jgi:mannosyltransferase
MNKKFLLWTFTVSAVLRLGFLRVAPAWYDESFSLILSRLPLARMLAATAGDTHPPLYYLLIWPLGQLHAPIWVLRIPGAILSLVAIWLFYRILQELNLPLRVQMAALILMAIMPLQLYYAQEARMYSLLEFLILAACLAMLRRRWVWFGLACALMLYTQYYAIFYIAALGLVALIRVINFHTFEGERKVNLEEYFNIFLSLGLAGLSFLPWLDVLINQMHNLHGTYWMQFTGPGMVLRILFENLTMPPANAVTQIPLMLACFAWLAVALIYAFRQRLENRGIILWLAFLPFALAILVSLVWQPILHYRPLIGISPFLYILLALPVEACFNENRLNRNVCLFASVFLIPLLLVTDMSMYLFAAPNKRSGASVALTYIQAHWQPGDIIYSYTDDGWVNSNPYITLPEFKAPDCGITLGNLSMATRLAIGQQIRPLSALTYKRAWVIWSESPLTPACVASQLPAIGLDPNKPILITDSDEYYFDGLWLLERK